jgi:hypothetical protein
VPRESDREDSGDEQESEGPFALPKEKRPRVRRSGNRPVLLIGGIVVLGCCLLVGLVVALWLVLGSDGLTPGGLANLQGGGNPMAPGPRSLDDPLMTPEQFDSVHAELRLSELEALMGPGRQVSVQELPLADKPTPGKEQRAEIERLSRKYRIRSWYLWTGKDRWAFAGFRTQQSSIVAWYFRLPDGRHGGSLEDSENTLP